MRWFQRSILFAVVLWTRVLGMPPKELVGRVIALQFVIHIIHDSPERRRAPGPGYRPG